MIREMLAFEPANTGTDIALALKESAQLLKKRSVIFLISDLIDEKDFSSAMKQLNRRHDLIALQICDPIEKKWPVDVPLLLEDAETGELIAVGGHSSAQLQGELDARSEAVKALCRSAGVDHVEIESGSEVLKPLIKFFAARNHRQRR